MTRQISSLFFCGICAFSCNSWGIGPMSFNQNGSKPSFEALEKKKAPRKNPLADKPFAELKKGKEKAIKDKDLATASKYLDAMRLVCTDHDLLGDILLEMADLYAQQEDWPKAEKAYNEFVLLYPGAKRCDYAHYKAVDCGWKLTLDPDRDQTKTQDTLKLAEQFLVDHPKSEYLEPVIKLTTQCREKLLESDVSIFNFYMHGSNFKAAQKRLDTITKEHIPQLPSHEPKAFELTIQLAQAQNNTESILRAQLDLGQKFPDHEITKRWVTDLPSVKTQLATLEQAKLSIEEPQEQIVA